VHCVDFWSIVLAQACDKEKPGKESELQALIYPLVQVSLGAIKCVVTPSFLYSSLILCNLRLISNARSFPFHLHILRSLLHLTRHTHTYIPLASYMLPILSNTLVPSARPKPSTLRPLDLDVVIRAPQQYLKTRVYSEVLVDETTFVLAEWLSCPPVLGSVAFPEMTVGVVVMLRKSLKAAKTNGAAGKEIGVVKALVEKLEESAKWVQERRKGVPFGPGKFDVVEEWEAQMRQKMGESPLGRHMKIVKKAREKRKALVEKVNADLQSPFFFTF
jgi:nucleolar complex protein 2